MIEVRAGEGSHRRRRLLGGRAFSKNWTVHKAELWPGYRHHLIPTPIMSNIKWHSNWPKQDNADGKVTVIANDGTHFMCDDFFLFEKR